MSAATPLPFPEPVEGRRREFGDGILFRFCTQVYAVGVVTVLLALACAPLVVVSVSLVRDVSNLIIVALAAIPVGPFWAAALYALRKLRDGTDQGPVRDFWRGLKINSRDVLLFWLPALVVGTVLGLDLAYLTASPNPADSMINWVVVALAIGFGLWAMNVLTIISAFTFRLRDSGRIALFFLLRKPVVTIGHAAILFVAGAVLYVGSDWILLPLAGGFAYLAVLNGQPMTKAVQANYVRTT